MQRTALPHATLVALIASACFACFSEEPPTGPNPHAAAPSRNLDWNPLSITGSATAAELTPETILRLRNQLAEHQRSAQSGKLLFRSRGGDLVSIPTLGTQVEISVTGPQARTRVSQRFRNPGPDWVEGIYVFPLPDDAAVDHMRIRTADQVIEGVIQEKEEARKTYERAKAEGRRASLVEQERPNVFTTHVANIAPDSEITIEIEYQQTVRLDDGESSLRFPMVAGPRYIPGEPLREGPPPVAQAGRGWSPDTDRVPDASRVTPPVRDPALGPINPVEISIDLAPGFEIDKISSPYHTIALDVQGDVAHVRLAEGEVPADRDFVLSWTAMPGSETQATLFSESFGGDHYALVMVVPPNARSAENDLPPREVIYVIDTSGSMSGPSLEQAKQALALALGRLRPNDRFNVIEFNSETNALFSGALFADRFRVARALQFIRNLESQGGTQILPAIRLALADQYASRDFLRQVIFLTDGSIGNEKEIFEVIQRGLGDSRLFTVGIGSAPNSHFMRKAAQHGRGSFIHIGKPEEVAEKMAGLFRKLESVLLRDIDLEVFGVQVLEQYPARIPDLYVGESISVALKLDKPLGAIALSGQSGDAIWNLEYASDDVRERTGVHVQWARRKIAALMDARLGVHDEGTLAQLRDETVTVAQDHHLVSAYTSLVAVDVTPKRYSSERLHSHALATNLPAGWAFGSVFGMASTATSAHLHLAMGLLLIGLGWLIRKPWALH
jgi:Ca-activated chloride channel family protein